MSLALLEMAQEREGPLTIPDTVLQDDQVPVVKTPLWAVKASLSHGREDDPVQTLRTD
jgi:hypothetical protein